MAIKIAEWVKLIRNIEVEFGLERPDSTKYELVALIGKGGILSNKDCQDIISDHVNPFEEAQKKFKDYFHAERFRLKSTIFAYAQKELDGAIEDDELVTLLDGSITYKPFFDDDLNRAVEINIVLGNRYGYRNDTALKYCGHTSPTGDKSWYGYNGSSLYFLGQKQGISLHEIARSLVTNENKRPGSIFIESLLEELNGLEDVAPNTDLSVDVLMTISLRDALSLFFAKRELRDYDWKRKCQVIDVRIPVDARIGITRPTSMTFTEYRVKMEKSIWIDFNYLFYLFPTNPANNYKLSESPLGGNVKLKKGASTFFSVQNTDVEADIYFDSLVMG